MNSRSELSPSADDMENVSEGFSDSATISRPIGVRSSPHSYVAAALVLLYFSGFMAYLEYAMTATAGSILALIVLPVLYLSDKVVFDGRAIIRKGLLPTWWSRFNRSRRRIRINDISLVETQAIRAVRRGTTVKYRYRTSFHGKGLALTVASGSVSFRELLQAILPQLDEGVLDMRSVDLRDHFADPKETLMKAEFARIPSAGSIESAFLASPSGRKRKSLATTPISRDEESPEELRSLGNELRVAGYLARGFEAIRRSVVMRPRDAAGLLDLGKCMISVSAATKNARIERRGLAVLRLAGIRGAGDSDLLTRLGECYAQIGYRERAEKIFDRIADGSSDTFRSARGRAEGALRIGKIAHVIHQYSTAERLARTAAQRKWANGESSYYSNLNNDEEYMQTEVARVSSLENATRAMGTTLRLTLFAFPVIFAGYLFDEPTVANVGWAISAVCLTIWCILAVITKFLSRRIPYELFEAERD